MYQVQRRRRTTRRKEVAADDASFFSYQVLSRRRTPRPAVVATDEAALFLVPDAMETYINTARTIVYIIKPVPKDEGVELARMAPIVKMVPRRMATRSSTSCSPLSTLSHQRDAV